MGNNVVSTTMKDLAMLEDDLPVIADLDILQKYNDVVVLRGLKEMRKIIDLPMEESVKTTEGVSVRIMDPSHKIKAFNSVIGLGKYIETRKINERVVDDIMELGNDELMIGGPDDD